MSRSKRKRDDLFDLFGDGVGRQATTNERKKRRRDGATAAQSAPSSDNQINIPAPDSHGPTNCIAGEARPTGRKVHNSISASETEPETKTRIEKSTLNRDTFSVTTKNSGYSISVSASTFVPLASKRRPAPSTSYSFVQNTTHDKRQAKNSGVETATSITGGEAATLISGRLQQHATPRAKLDNLIDAFNNVYRALNLQNVKQAIRQFYNSLSLENAKRALPLALYLAERLLARAMNLVDGTGEAISRCRPALELADALCVHLRDLIRDASADAHLYRKGEQRSMDVMELPGLPGIGDLFETYVFCINSIESTSTAKKRKYGEMIAPHAPAKPRPRHPYILQRVRYFLEDLFNKKDYQGIVYEFGMVKTRLDYDDYLRLRNEPYPSLIDANAVDPRPDLPQPRPLNPPLYKKAWYKLRDIFPQDLNESSNRADYDEFLRNERRPETIMRKKANYEEHLKIMALQRGELSQQTQRYCAQHVETALTASGECPRCEYSRQHSMASAKPALTFTDLKPLARSPDVPFEAPLTQFSLAQPVQSLFTVPEPPSALTSAEIDARLGLLYHPLSEAQSFESELVVLEQEARDNLLHADYIAACEGTADAHYTIVSILKTVEEVENSIPSHQRPNIIRSWLSSNGHRGEARLRFLRDFSIPEMDPHTGSASSTEGQTAKRRKLSMSGQGLASQSDPLSTFSPAYAAYANDAMNQAGPMDQGEAMDQGLTSDGDGANDHNDAVAGDGANGGGSSNDEDSMNGRDDVTGKTDTSSGDGAYYGDGSDNEDGTGGDDGADGQDGTKVDDKSDGEGDSDDEADGLIINVGDQKD